MSKRKRGHGEGSIFFDRTRKVWTSAVPDGRGKRKYFRDPVKDRVREQMDAFRAQLRAGQVPDPSRELMVDYLERWMTEVAKPRTKPSTYVSYRSVIDRWIKPNIDNVPTTHFNAEMVSNLLTACRKKGAGSRTLENMFIHLRNAMNHLVEIDRISKNPCKPKLKPVHRAAQMKVWTPEDAEKFLLAACDDWYFPAYYFTLITGLREGEVSALPVSNLYLDRMEVKVSLNRSQVSKKKARELYGVDELPLAPPKGDREESVSFGPETARVLRTWLATRLKMGFAGKPEVFLTTDGNHIRPSYLYKVFVRACKRAGVPVIRFHDLRHTSATLAFLKGYSVTDVQHRLRHKSASTTLNTYLAHINEARARTLGADMERIGPAKQEQAQ